MAASTTVVQPVVVEFTFDDGASLTVPRAALAAASPVLAAMFTGGFAEASAAQVHVANVPSAAFRLLLEAQRGEAVSAEVPVETLAAVYDLVDQYDMAAAGVAVLGAMALRLRTLSTATAKNRQVLRPSVVSDFVLIIETLRKGGKLVVPPFSSPHTPAHYLSFYEVRSCFHLTDGFWSLLLNGEEALACICRLNARYILEAIVPLMAVESQFAVSFLPRLWRQVLLADWVAGLQVLLRAIPGTFPRDETVFESRDRRKPAVEEALRRGIGAETARILLDDLKVVPSAATLESLFATNAAACGLLLYRNRHAVDCWALALGNGRIDCLNLLSLSCMHDGGGSRAVERMCAARGASGNTLLIAAAHIGAIETCRWLLQRGAASVIDNATNNESRTALHCAAAADNAGIVDLLLAHGANPDVVDANGKSPFSAAATSSAERSLAIRATLEAASLQRHQPRSVYGRVFLDEMRAAHNAAASAAVPAGRTFDTAEAFYQHLLTKE